MRLKVDIRKGNFDWCHPEEQQLSVRCLITDIPEPLVTNLHLPVDDELYWEQKFERDIVEGIKEAIKLQKTLFVFSSEFKEQDKILEFIKKHETELYLTHEQDKLDKIIEKITSLEKEKILVKQNIKILQEQICEECGLEKNGVCIKSEE